MRAKQARHSLELVCPRCGHAAEARINRMNQLRTCAMCGAMFSIDERGRYVVHQGWSATWLGMRVTSLQKRLHLSRTIDRWSAGTEGKLSMLSKHWTRIPAAWRAFLSLTIGGGLLILLAISMYTYWALNDDTPQEEITQSLQVRADFACRALLLGDDAVLAGLSSSDTREHARNWMLQVRPGAWPVNSQELAEQATIETETLFKSTKTRRAAVYFKAWTTPTRRAGTPPEAEGLLCWTMGHDGRWELDCRQMLQEISSFRRTD